MGKRISLGKAWNHVEHSVEVDEEGFTYIEHVPTTVEDEILDECAKLRGLQQNSRSNFQLAAKVPIATHTAWKKEWREKYSDTWEWPTFLAMKLNNRDNAKLRTGARDHMFGKKLPTGQIIL